MWLVPLCDIPDDSGPTSTHSYWSSHLTHSPPSLLLTVFFSAQKWALHPDMCLADPPTPLLAGLRIKHSNSWSFGTTLRPLLRNDSTWLYMTLNNSKWPKRTTQEKTIGAERSIFTTALSSIVIELVAEPTLSFVLVLVSPFSPAPLPFLLLLFLSSSSSPWLHRADRGAWFRLIGLQPLIRRGVRRVEHPSHAVGQQTNNNPTSQNINSLGSISN